MAPKPKHSSPVKKSRGDVKKFSRIFADSDGDEIVIAGMAGRFPKSENVMEYKHNLYNKVDMVDESEIRWPHTIPDIPKRSGKISNINKFDATFFGVTYKQAQSMDPQCRMVMEKAYEAVLDAGINPTLLRGSKTGVYVGACISETELNMFMDEKGDNGFGVTGSSRAMLANRISYAMGCNGPSLTMDTACSSSMTALDMAFTAFRNGEVDGALVCGVNLTMHPYVTMQFAKLGVLAKNGYCCPFDKDAYGYTRSEAISCLFLQRKRDAKRIYATLVYTKTNCDGFKPEGITFPAGVVQERLLREFYNDIDVSVNELGYMEAHSTGTVVGDPEECRAIDNVICMQRDHPLLVGSVKSNIGHSEPASGICSMVKVMLAFQNGSIPPNINFREVRPDIPALSEGRLQVVTEITKLTKPYVGINSFGFGGSNVHALVKAYDKVKQNNGLPEDDVPRLVVWSSRTEDGANQMFDFLETHPLDVEYLALLNNIQSKPIPGFVFRGFGLFQKGAERAECLAKDVQHYTGINRPVVWVFSGMGSQWIGMGASLMQIPIFKESITRCYNALKPSGLDLIKIITSTEKTMFDNILHSFVGIAAIQIGLVDILRTLDISPDFIIGHSVGELGCAYADGAFTPEQMILAAYYRGKVSLDAEKIVGSMAAIGLSYKEIRNRLPEEIEVACHNSSNSCTISGPADEVARFVKTLTDDGIFAKEVPCSNIAYHSRYIAHLGPMLLKYLQHIIPHPKRRSSKWLSSSIPYDKWSNPESNLCSAEYHTNNLLNSVLFEETSQYLPENSLTIEIAPHGLLQAILKRSFPGGVHIGLTQRGHKNNRDFFFGSLGKLYIQGLDMPIDRLYPKVQWPVSLSTPTISHLISWEHSMDWQNLNLERLMGSDKCERLYKLTLAEEEFTYLKGHTIDGKVLVPATFYLHCVWDTFSRMTHGPMYWKISVEFQNVKFLQATTLTEDQTVELAVVVHYATGEFEISVAKSLVVSGKIQGIEKETLPSKIPAEDSSAPIVSNKDFYNELKLRGYHYNGEFRAVQEARGDGRYGLIEWTGNWVPFMDCMLQAHIIGKDSRNLLLPTRIRRMRIFPQHHLQVMQDLDADRKLVKVQLSAKQNRVLAGGIEISGLHATAVQRRRAPGIPVLERYQFVPHLRGQKLSPANGARLCVQLALENNPKLRLKIVEHHDNVIEPIINYFLDSIEDLPTITGDFLLLTPQELDLPGITVEQGPLSAQTGCYIVIANKVLNNNEFVQRSEPCLKEALYIVSREVSGIQTPSAKVPDGFDVIAVIPVSDAEDLVLLKKMTRSSLNEVTCIRVSLNDSAFDWVQRVQNSLGKTPILLVAEKEKFSGILGLINCLRREPDGDTIRCVFIDDAKAPKFDLADPFYAKQLEIGLAVNVLRNGQWGGYHHLQLTPEYPSIPHSDHIYGNMINRGDLSSLRWLQGSLPKDQFDVKIMYSSLNFRDIMLATGRLPVEVFGEGRLDQSCFLGFEYSGIERETKRAVMGMAVKGCVASYVESEKTLVWYVPKGWSLREAATVPVVYITVYYAFFVTTDIRKGKSILIHAGSGGIGLAAIRVALAYGLEVYTTVSSKEKRKFLLNLFPKLKESHIGNSRDISFEEMIQEQTNGKGVDFVLNSLSEDKLIASIRCLGKGGKFLEIGKFDMANDNKLGLGDFLNELTFHAVLADNLLTADKSLIIELRALIDKDIANGIVQPLPSTVFPAHEIEQAFRFLIGGKHIGKVLIQVRPEGTTEPTMPVKVVPQVYFDPKLVYIVPGGLGGFGLELVDWMALRGARKLVLSSSRGISNTYQTYRIALWNTYGCEISISTADITTKSGCETLLREAAKLGPIGGIFNLAVSLQDAIFTNQTPEKFQACFKPKAIATIYLDELTRKLCPKLQHFVVFSSVSCGRGNPGQSNYGMANSIMERIVEDRVDRGYPGKAIQWGAVGEVGLVAIMAEGKIDLEIGGTLQQRISSCISELDTLLTCGDPIVASMVVAEKRIGREQKMGIIETVMNIMNIKDLKSISLGATISEMGMDSLMAVELKQTLERDFDLVLTPQDLRSLTFQKLQEYASQAVAPRQGKSTPDAGYFNEMDILCRNLGDEKNSDKIILQANQHPLRGDRNTSIIIPGIEGVSGEALLSVGANLGFNAAVLQFYKTGKAASIKEIADAVFEDVKSVLGNSRKYYLVGYSFGALLTIQLASMLEQCGYSGNILLIDGSPAFLKYLAHKNFEENKPGEYGNRDEFIQNSVITQIVSKIFNEGPFEVVWPMFANLPTYEEKLLQFCKCSDKQSIYSKEYAMQIYDGIINRVKISYNDTYDSLHPVNADIVLLKPATSFARDLAPDYELSKYTKGTVQMRVIDGDHTTILNNPLLPSIITEFDPFSG